MIEKKQYHLKHPVTIALVDEEAMEIVLRTESNGLLFVPESRFKEDFEEVKNGR